MIDDKVDEFNGPAQRAIDANLVGPDRRFHDDVVRHVQGQFGEAGGVVSPLHDGESRSAWLCRHIHARGQHAR